MRTEPPAPGPDGTPHSGPRATTAEVETTSEDFADFYHRTYATYLAYASRFTASRDGAQDAVHDTFTDLYARWSTIRQPASYGVRTLRHKLQDQARRMARTVPTYTFDDSPDEVALADLVERRTTLLQALRELPPTRRRIVVAYYIQDFTTAEIATSLGITPSTVRAHLVHARRDLRDLLDDSRPPSPATNSAEPGTPAESAEPATTAPQAEPAPDRPVYDQDVETVYRYIAMLTGTGSAAEDLTSQTIRYALAHRATHEASKTWLIATARTFVTKEGDETAPAADDRHDAVTALIDAAAHGPTVVDAPLDISTLLGALQLLNPAQYECIVLRFLQGMTVAESAHVMNRTEGAMKVLQHRALKNLAQHLGEKARADDSLQPADISETLNEVVAPRCSHYIRPNLATHRRLRAAVEKKGQHCPDYFLIR
ncbi:sigma-70 family RNA polymerase sigma factor [Streptomyces olivaceus]